MAATPKPTSSPVDVLLAALTSIRDYGDLSKNASPRRDLMVELSSADCAAIARNAIVKYDLAGEGLKTFALICKTFGRKFSFHAASQEDAEAKARGWCRYHSFTFVDFSVEEVEPCGDIQDLHNEYVEK